MDAINSPTTAPIYQPDNEYGLRTLQASKADLAVVTLTKQMDIDLVTAEGDKVTLSVDSRSAGLYAAFEDVQTDDSGAAAYEKSELTMGLYQREMSLTVEGDLNAAERRDIKKVLKTLDNMMNKFVSGKLMPMAAQARKLQGLNTIADLDVQMSFESQTLIAKQSRSAATYDRLGQPSALQAEPPESGITIPAAEADTVADAMAEAIQSTPTPAYRMMQSVNRLLNDYRRQMEDLNPIGRQVMDRIGSRLSRVLAESAIDAHSPTK